MTGFTNPTVDQVRERCGINDTDTAGLQGVINAAIARVDQVRVHSEGDGYCDCRFEAIIRLSAYLWNQPQTSSGTSYANAFRNSGAQAILAPWVHTGMGVAG